MTQDVIFERSTIFWLCEKNQIIQERPYSGERKEERAWGIKKEVKG
jgi:hypothetical protein